MAVLTLEEKEKFMKKIIAALEDKKLSKLAEKVRKIYSSSAEDFVSKKYYKGKEYDELNKKDMLKFDLIMQMHLAYDGKLKLKELEYIAKQIKSGKVKNYNDLIVYDSLKKPRLKSTKKPKKGMQKVYNSKNNL